MARESKFQRTCKAVQLRCWRTELRQTIRNMDIIPSLQSGVRMSNEIAGNLADARKTSKRPAFLERAIVRARTAQLDIDFTAPLSERKLGVIASNQRFIKCCAECGGDFNPNYVPMIRNGKFYHRPCRNNRPKRYIRTVALNGKSAR
jgi:hypothetical protein